jgi:hypothetical protein
VTPLAAFALGVFIAAFFTLSELALKRIRRTSADIRELVLGVVAYLVLITIVVFSAAIHVAERGM